MIYTVYIMAKRAIEIRWDSAKVGGTFHSCFKNSCYNKIPTIFLDRGDFIIRGVVYLRLHKRCDQACKPSSVVNSHLSWPDVAITARRHLLGTRRAGAIRSSAVLLRIGFTQPRSLLRAGELLPRLSTLTGKAGGNFLLHYP